MEVVGWGLEAAGVAGLGSIAVVGGGAGRDEELDTEKGRHGQVRLGLFLLARRGDGGLAESLAGWALGSRVRCVEGIGAGGKAKSSRELALRDADVGALLSMGEGLREAVVLKCGLLMGAIQGDVGSVCMGADDGGVGGGGCKSLVSVDVPVTSQAVETVRDLQSAEVWLACSRRRWRPGRAEPGPGPVLPLVGKSIR